MSVSFARVRCSRSAPSKPREAARCLGEQLRPPSGSPAVPRQRGLPMAVVRKLKKILEEAFPPPDKVHLRDKDRIIGVVTSKRFRRMDTMQRQDLLHDILGTQLTAEEQRHVLLIVAVTPEEEVANA